MSRRRLRRPLRLSPRGVFVFTERTTSFDVSDIVAGPGSSRTLHVGRSRGAIEPDDKSPAWAVDAPFVVAVLEILDQRRKDHGEPPATAEIDPRSLASLRVAARSVLQAQGSAAPFGQRPAECLETRGAHPGECLWIATDTGETVLETRSPRTDDRGQLLGFDSSSRSVSAAEAIDWILEDGYSSIPAILASKRGRSRRDQ